MYYSVSFRYPGPYSNCGEGIEANIALCNAEEKVRHALNSLAINFKHQYSWPDGSCYKWISSDLPLEVLEEKITKALDIPGNVVKLDAIALDDPNCDPWKAGCKTLTDYMEETYKTNNAEID